MRSLFSKIKHQYFIWDFSVHPPISSTKSGTWARVLEDCPDSLPVYLLQLSLRACREAPRGALCSKHKGFPGGPPPKGAHNGCDYGVNKPWHGQGWGAHWFLKKMDRFLMKEEDLHTSAKEAKTAKLKAKIDSNLYKKAERKFCLLLLFFFHTVHMMITLCVCADISCSLCLFKSQMTMSSADMWSLKMNVSALALSLLLAPLKHMGQKPSLCLGMGRVFQ